MSAARVDEQQWRRWGAMVMEEECVAEGKLNRCTACASRACRQPSSCTATTTQPKCRKGIVCVLHYTIGSIMQCVACPKGALRQACRQCTIAESASERMAACNNGKPQRRKACRASAVKRAWQGSSAQELQWPRRADRRRTGVESLAAV